MNKRRTFLIIGVIAVFVVVAGILAERYIGNKDEVEDTGIEKNYGISYASNELTTNTDGSVNISDINISEIVPAETVLIQNLTVSEYNVEKFDTVMDTEINASRIYASRNEHFIDITYCGNEDEANEVFSAYEKEYKEFYLLAQNGCYVYCVSDNETFTEAGFTALTNIGVQYINHDRY
ncbi:MAG TPA: hypothetical protein VHQ24_14955 [Lachnospiraceae bacterium]|nr:hypothetical protein [Lachnospiraceae bacterium]HEX3078158.1 hypothetical protein [Lachnospiraceae bacterium]